MLLYQSHVKILFIILLQRPILGQPKQEARKILRDVGIEPVTDPRNLVVLPHSYHASLHTTAYHSYVTERLRLVEGDKEGVEATLASLRAEIFARSVAGIRWD